MELTGCFLALPAVSAEVQNPGLPAGASRAEATAITANALRIVT